MRQDSERIKTTGIKDSIHSNNKLLGTPFKNIHDGGLSPGRRNFVEVDIPLPTEIHSHKN